MPARPAPTAEGHFTKTPFAHVVLYMRERALTGTLAIQAGDGTGELAGETLVTFDRGAATQARTPALLDPLGVVMRDQGSIDEAQFRASVARIEAGERMQGQILLTMGACDDAAIERGLREQLRRKLAHYFAIENAAYQYFDGVDLLAGYGAARIHDDAFAVLWRGVRAFPAQRMLDSVLARVGNQALRVRANATDLPRFEFAPNEQRVVDRMRTEPLTLDAIPPLAPDPRVSRALAYVLVAAKQVDIVPAPSTRAAPTTQAATPAPARTAAPVRAATPAPSADRTGPQSAVRTPVSAVAADRASPPPPQRPALTPELQGRLVEAESRLTKMEDESYFQMLNVPISASTDAIHGSFLELAARWHPDRVPPSAVAVREVYQKIFAYVTEARDTLCNDTARGRYLATVQDGGGTPNAQRKIASMIEAATDAQKAEVCLRRREYDEGERLARRALRITAEDPNALAILAAILMERRSDAPPPDDAEQLLHRAVKAAPKHDRAHMLLGTWYRRRGNGAKAVAHFRLALEANPKNMDAQREVRVADMRSRNSSASLPAMDAATGEEKPKRTEGIFSKLLKR